MTENPAAPFVPPERSDRILVRSVNWLGDAVMTTPALLRLREARPRAHVSLLTHEKLAELWRHHPAVDEVIPFPSGAGLRAVAQRIRAGRFEVGVVLPNSPRAALELWWGRVPTRIGIDTPLRRFLLTRRIARPAGLALMRKRPVREIRKLAVVGNRSKAAISHRFPEEAHHIHHYLHLMAGLGANEQPLPPRLVVTDAEMREAVSKFMPDLKGDGGPPESLSDRPVFGLCPGAEYGPAKRWPVRNFVEAARELSRRTRCRWIILGGRGDIGLAKEVAAGIGGNVWNQAGLTSLRELMSLLRFCRVVLTNDTGPMHLAAAVGTRVAAIFGSTSPELTGPGLPGDRRHRLLSPGVTCSPCFRRECPIDFRCMTQISVVEAVNAVLEMHEPPGAGR